MRLIVVSLETPGLSCVFRVTSWGRMSEGEDVGGTLWGRMSEGGNPRDGRSGIFSRKRGWPSEVCKGPSLRPGFSCIFDWQMFVPADQKFVEGVSRVRSEISG